MTDVRSYRLLMGLLAAAWIGIGAAVIYALARTGMIAEPIGIATALAILLGAAGAVGSWMFRKWGVALYLTASVLVLVKPWLFTPAEPVDAGGWGYWVMLGFYIVLVAAQWKQFERRA